MMRGIVSIGAGVAVVAAVMWLAPGAHPQTVKIDLTAPASYQVVQRIAKDVGLIPIRGKTDATVTRIIAKAQPLPGMPGKATAWEVVARRRQIKKGVFTGHLPATAGGWYMVQVRALRGGATIGQATIRKVGVGEVFVVCGQSNSANHGQPPQQPRSDRVAAFIGTGWRHGYDPQPLATGNGGSPWPAMGDFLVEHLGVPVAYASCGVGGTRVDQWQPDGSLYPRLQTVLKALGPNGARAVLWHQGESDAASRTAPRVYRDRLERVIKESRKDAGFDIPWMVAGVSYLPGLTNEQMDAVREGQRMLWEDRVALKGPETDSLLELYRYDTVHFNEEGLKLHGERWFLRLRQQFFSE